MTDRYVAHRAATGVTGVNGVIGVTGVTGSLGSMSSTVVFRCNASSVCICEV